MCIHTTHTAAVAYNREWGKPKKHEAYLATLAASTAQVWCCGCSNRRQINLVLFWLPPFSALVSLRLRNDSLYLILFQRGSNKPEPSLVDHIDSRSKATSSVNNMFNPDDDNDNMTIVSNISLIKTVVLILFGYIPPFVFLVTLYTSPRVFLSDFKLMTKKTKNAIPRQNC